MRRRRALAGIPPAIEPAAGGSAARWGGGSPPEMAVTRQREGESMHRCTRAPRSASGSRGRRGGAGGGTARRACAPSFGPASPRPPRRAGGGRGSSAWGGGPQPNPTTRRFSDAVCAALLSALGALDSWRPTSSGGRRHAALTLAPCNTGACGRKSCRRRQEPRAQPFVRAAGRAGFGGA